MHVTKLEIEQLHPYCQVSPWLSFSPTQPHSVKAICFKFAHHSLAASYLRFLWTGLVNRAKSLIVNKPTECSKRLLAIIMPSIKY